MRKKHILPQDIVFKISHELRKQGKTVGLTHGAFDLFHVGHLDLLTQAADKCDFLIVGVDSDESIKAYKSIDRPIIDQKQRLKIISQLNCVDAVFIKDKDALDEDYAIDLYKEISPNFLAVGNEFTNESIVRMLTDRAGIKVKQFLSHEPLASTTAIINKIARGGLQDW